MTFQKMMKAAGFAHLLGLPKAAKAEDGDDDKKKQRDDESDEDYAKRMEDGDDKKDAKAEDDDAEDDKKPDGDDEDDKKSKKAGKAEEGDDDESMQAARTSERARCAAIFASPSAGVRPDMAAHLAFNTSMSRKEAIAMLDAVAAGSTRPSGLAARMAGAKVPNIGADAEGAGGEMSPKSVAAQIIAAGEKARGGK
jgi:hypothetical protein